MEESLALADHLRARGLLGVVLLVDFDRDDVTKHLEEANLPTDDKDLRELCRGYVNRISMKELTSPCDESCQELQESIRKFFPFAFRRSESFSEADKDTTDASQSPTDVEKTPTDVCRPSADIHELPADADTNIDKSMIAALHLLIKYTELAKE